MRALGKLNDHNETRYFGHNFVNAERKYVNVIWTQFLILPAPDIFLCIQTC